MIDAELIKDFVVDSMDLLDDVEPKLIEFQHECDASGAGDPDSINAVFRLFHSMKGSAGFLQLANITSLTHEAETLLDMFRRGKYLLTKEHTNLFFRAMDLIRTILNHVDENLTDKGFEEPVKNLVVELKAAIKGEFLTQEKCEMEKNKTIKAGGEKIGISESTEIVTEEDNMMQSESMAASEDIDSVLSADSAPVIDEFIIPITPEMLERFVTESDELLEQFEHALLAIEQEKDDEMLATAFRAIHSFKGNCGFMGLSDMEKISHNMENVMDAMRYGKVEIDAGNVGSLLKMNDVLRNAVVDVSNSGSGKIPNLDLYLEFFNDMFPTSKVEEQNGIDEEVENAIKKPTPERVVEAAPPVKKPLIEAPVIDLGDDDGNDDFSDGPSLMINQEKLARIKAKMEMQEKEPDMVELDEEPVRAKTPPSINKAEVAISSVKPAKAIVRKDIRVDLNKLDTLINLVGELVIAEAMMTRHPSVKALEDEGIERAIHQLRRVSRDLQDVAMTVRMIPLASTFQKMIRLVHDLSSKSGKKVSLFLSGEETEVDKTVIEQIADPFVHIIRNAIDHGIESPAERIKNGKPETGEIRIEGRHEGGEVWITIKDDGQGLRRERIIQKAIKQNLIKGDGSNLSDKEVHKLIFEPGFSTSEKITDISGRGVGMDVVRRNIEKLKGKVDLVSVEGKGSTFTLRIPLTLAIIEGMLLRVGDTCYTLPLLTIRESLRPQRKQITTTPDGQELVRVREELIPVVRLHEVFNKKSDTTDLTEGILIIVEEDDHIVCLFVDEILGQQETVIKGLSRYLGNARGVAGCTILGNGEVSLILDVSAMIGVAKEQALL